MTPDLVALTAVIVLAVVQVGLGSVATLRQAGPAWVLSPRDRGAPQGDDRHQRVKWHGRSTLEADWELGTDGPSRCGMIPRRLCMHKIKVPRVLDGVAWFMPFAVSPTTGPIAPAALEPPLKPSKPGSMHACTTGTGSPRPGPASGR